MIEIYNRLEPVTANVYPDTPNENADLPFVVYRISSTEPQLHTGGVSGIVRYTVEVETYAVNKAEVTGLQSAVRTQLHGYRGGSIQGAFLQTESGEEIELGHHGVQTFSVWVSGTATYANAEALAANTIFAPKLLKITDWTLQFATSPNPERLGVFKYVNKRSGAHRKSYTPHKGKRWELVFELPTSATTWTYPTNYAGSVRPWDNYPWTNPNGAGTLNLRKSGTAKRWRIGAMHGGAWHLSTETLLYSFNATSKLNASITKIGLVG